MLTLARCTVLLLASLSAALIASESTAPLPASGYALVFDEEFDSLDLSPTGSGLHTWYQQVWWDRHIPRRSLLSTSNGILSLNWEPGQGSNDTSITTFAHDKTGGKTWRYGYFEARMRWSPVRGAWPALWLIPAQDARGENMRNGVKETGELDVFEGQGDEPHRFYGTVHGWLDKHDSMNKPNWVDLPADFSFGGFHTYGVLWVPGRVTWYLDGRELHSAPTPAILDRQDYFLVIGSQEGTDWQAGATTGVTSKNLRLDVDWVRVWQKRGR